MSARDWGECYQLLAALAGASEGLRDSFVEYLSEPSPFRWEFRFQGTLGFGGKLHWDGHTAPRVSCYREDETASRRATIARANAALAGWWEARP